MKNMKYLLMIVFAASVALGAKISDNILIIGDQNPAVDKEQQMGDGRIKWDSASSKLQFSNDAGSNFADFGTGSGSGSGGINLLTGDDNPGFETNDPPTAWTASGGTFVAETGSPGFGDQSGSFDSDALGQTLDSNLKSVIAGLEGRSCNATIQYKYDTGASGDYKLQALANTGGTLAEIDLGVTGAQWQKAAVQFTCPSSDSIRVRIISDVADADVILLDDATIGQSDLVNVSQSLLVAHAFYPQSGAVCNWGVVSVSFADFPPTVACPGIAVNFSTFPVNTADNDLPDIDFPDLPAGTYLVEATFPGFATTGNAFYGYTISDGTTNGSRCSAKEESVPSGVRTMTCSHVFEYSGSGPRNFKMQGFASTGTVAIANDQSNGLGNLVWKVTKFPDTAAEAITLETTGKYVDVQLTATNMVLPAGTSSFPNISATDGVITNKGTLDAGAACQGVNGAGATTCDSEAVNEVLGVSFTPHKAGLWNVCGYTIQQFTTVAVAGNGIAADWYLQRTTLDGGSTQDAATPLISNQYITPVNVAQTLRWPIEVCGVFDLPASEVRFQLGLNQAQAGTGTTQNVALTGFGALLGSSTTSFQAWPYGEAKPTPVFTDLQNSLNGKLETNNGAVKSKFITAVASCDPTPTIDSNFDASLISISYTSPGLCTVNFANPFNSVVFCQCTSSTLSASQACRTGAVTNSSAQLQLLNATGTANDGQFTLFCVGDN